MKEGKEIREEKIKKKIKKQAEKASKIEVKERIWKIKNILSSHEKEREL